MKRKLLTCLILMAIGLGLFVSCNAETVVPDEDGVAYIRFGEDTRRGDLTASYKTKSYDEVYWFYTAEKTDGFGEKGQTTKETPVVTSGDSPAMGLGSGYLAQTFSQGTWEFTLQAYTSGTTLNNTTLVYQTKEAIKVTLLGGESKVIGVSVEPMQKTGNVFFNNAYFKWSENTGNAPYFKMEATSGENKYIFTNDSVILEDTNNTGKGSVIKLDLSTTNSGAAYKVDLKNNSTSGVSLATGTYQCDVTAYVRKDGSYSNTNVATFRFWFAVYGSADTTITGDLTEGVFSKVKFAVKERVLETLKIENNTATFGSAVKTEDAAPTDDAKIARKKQEQPQVVMDFSGVTAAAGGAVTSATLESEVVVGAEASEGFTVVDTTEMSETEKTNLVVASISLTAKDQNGAEIGKQTTGSGEEKTGGFGKAQTITKFIGGGLNGGVTYAKGTGTSSDTGTCNLKIYYNNEEEDDIVVTAYNPGTGYITFTTTHFSTFVIVDTSKFPVKVSTITSNNNQDQATKTVKGYYKDLAEAFAATKTVAKTDATSDGTEEVSVIESGDTITIQQNTSVKETIVIDKDLTLDLGGKTISSECRVFDVQSGTFTIQSTDGEGKAAKGGTIEATISDSGSSAVKVSSKQGAAVLDLETGATIKAPTSYGISALKDKDGTYDNADTSYTAVLNIKGTIESGNPCVGTNGSKDEKVTTTINILDGAVLTQDASNILTGKTIDRCAVYQPSIKGTLNISGGTITSKDGSAVEIRAGKGHTISGGTLTSNADMYITANGNGPTVRGAAVAVSQHDTKQPITLTISGGKFNAKKALSVVNPQNNATDVAKTVVVTVENNAIADKDIDAVKVDGKYYPTFEAAVKVAEGITKGDGTITLLGDRSSNKINLETKDLKVVLNGHTLTGTAAYGIVFCPKNGKTITIDGTAEGSGIAGTIMCTSGTTGNIVVNGGTYESNGYVPFYVNGAVPGLCNVTIKNAVITTTETVQGDTDDPYNSHGVFLSGLSKTTLEGCTITGVSTGIEIRGGDVSIINCTVNSLAGTYDCKANSSGTTTTGATVAVAQHTTHLKTNVAISGKKTSLNGAVQLAVTNPQKNGAEYSKDVKVTVADISLNENKIVGVKVGTDTYYPTLEGAIANGATDITLMNDITLVDSVTIKDGKSYVINLNGHTISKDDSPFIVKHGSLELTGSGTVQETVSYGHAPIMIYGSSTSTDKNYSVITVGKDVTLKGWAGLWINIADKNNTSTHHAYGVVVNMKGKIVVPAAEEHVSTGLQGIYVQGFIKDESGNVPEITLDGAEITSSDDGLYAAGYAKWIIKNTTINAPNGNGLVLASGEFEISGDTKITAGTEIGEQGSIGGSISSKRSSAIYVKQHDPNPTLKVTVKDGSFYSYIPFYQDKGEATTPAPNKVTLSIEGGSFVSNSASGSVSIKSEDKTGFITGGTFSTEPDASYIASGYAAVKNETSGTWTVKATN